MNLANKFTMLRIVISFFFILFLCIPVAGSKIIALALFLAGMLTDYLDGFIARRYGVTSDLGKLLDPLADKILLGSAFINFISVPPLNIPAWMVIIIIMREFIVTGLRTMGILRGKVISADWYGKQKTISQTITVSAGLVILAIMEGASFFNYTLPSTYNYWASAIMWILTFITVVHTTVTGLYYLWEYREIILSD